MQVDDVGKGAPLIINSSSWLASKASGSRICWMHGAGSKLANPRRGCREHEVMNFKNFRCCSAVISSIISQNHSITDCEGWYPAAYCITFLSEGTSIPWIESSPDITFCNSCAENRRTQLAEIKSRNPRKNARVWWRVKTFNRWWETRRTYWTTFAFVTEIFPPFGKSSIDETVDVVAIVSSNVRPRLSISDFDMVNNFLRFL